MKRTFAAVTAFLAAGLLLLGGGTAAFGQENTEPSLEGSPSASVTQGREYYFRPTLVDPDDGQTHEFAIINKPGWATFNSQTGELRGTPSRGDLGTFKGITITANDSGVPSLSGSISFSIKVNPAVVEADRADLSVQTAKQEAVIRGLPDASSIEAEAIRQEAARIKLEADASRLKAAALHDKADAMALEAEASRRIADAEDESDPLVEIAGFTFGLGLAYVQYGEAIQRGVTIDSQGIVRVDHEDTTTYKVVLTAVNDFPWNWGGSIPGFMAVIGVEPTNPIDSFGIGFNLGFGEKERVKRFNFSLGVLFHEITNPAEDYTKDSAAPTSGATVIPVRYETKDVQSTFLSFGISLF